MENTTEQDQEIKDGAQAPAETSPATDTAVQDNAPVDAAETSQEATQDDAEQDWKAHARTWERRAKADHKQLEALTEAINGKDTTIEELRSQVAALEAQAHRAKLIAAAASEYGVPADLIHGDTEDEIKEIAQRLADWRGATATPASRSTTPPRLPPNSSHHPTSRPVRRKPCPTTHPRTLTTQTRPRPRR